jgi:dihydropyrimidinase
MRLSAELLASASDDTPYAGMEVTGVPVCTILRGRTIVRERHFLGLPGEGRFLRRVPASGR